MEVFNGKEYVYEVYKERSFSKAAKNLYISQPSLSASVKRVEEKVGFPIFDRSTAPISLTDCGIQYIKATERMKAVEADFERYVDDMSKLRTGTLFIGGSNLFSSYILPPMITAFTEKYPLIQIHLIEESTMRLEEQLLDGTLDLMIDNFEFDDALFERYFYQSEHLLLVVPRRYPVVEQLSPYELSVETIVSQEYLKEEVEAVPLKAFAKVPFIFLKPENDTMKRGMKKCKSQGLTPHINMNLDQQMTAYNVACSGMGACFASDILLQYGLQHSEVAYYKLNNKECQRNIYFYHKRGRYVTMAMQEFLNMCLTNDSVKERGK
ncbi:MAG: LysR family transcriptional regulator [Lachnospiraceae bacterium]